VKLPITVKAPGYTAIPALPSIGTGVTTGAVNTFGALTQLIAATSTSLLLTQITLRQPAAGGSTYLAIALYIGPAGLEELQTQDAAGVNQPLAGYAAVNIDLLFPLLIPINSRITARTASDTAGQILQTRLIVIDPANLSEP
jgi:hypothetical protein